MQALVVLEFSGKTTGKVWDGHAKQLRAKADGADGVKVLSICSWLIDVPEGLVFVGWLTRHARKNGWACRKLNLYGLNHNGHVDGSPPKRKKRRAKKTK